MGALLAIVLFFNVLGALFLVPGFVSIFKPKFITNFGQKELDL
jgi:predicted RND superfamily exporter protein